MRRFQCPECGELLLEGTTECPKCLASTEGIVAPPAPSELFPEMQFGTHEQGVRFAELIERAKEHSAPETLFYREFQLAQWGSPWLEEYLRQIAADPSLVTSHVDIEPLVIGEKLSQQERAQVRHVLTQLQNIPPDVQAAFLECMKLKRWTPVQSLPPAAQKWLPALERAGAVTTKITPADREHMLRDQDLRYLLNSHEINDTGDRAALLARIRSRVQAREWSGFVLAKTKGDYVRCSLPAADALLRYVEVRRHRIALLAKSILHRIAIEEEAVRFCIERDATQKVVDKAGIGLPPYHPGCRCHIDLREGHDHRRHIIPVAGAGACRICLDNMQKALEILKTIGGPPPQTQDSRVRVKSAVELGKAGLCPRCQTTMYKARRHGLQFFACSDCLGIWLGKAQIDDFFIHHFDLCGKLDTDMRTHSHDDDDAHQKPQCPDCHSPLADFPFAYELPAVGVLTTEVVTHRCDHCAGVWFDGGELHWVWRGMMILMGREV